MGFINATLNFELKNIIFFFLDINIFFFLLEKRLNFLSFLFIYLICSVIHSAHKGLKQFILVQKLVIYSSTCFSQKVLYS
jgi:hypothetical protein